MQKSPKILNNFFGQLRQKLSKPLLFGLYGAVGCLGAEPVLLGSSEDAHTYLRKSQRYPPITAKIYTEGEKIIMEFD